MIFKDFLGRTKFFWKLLEIFENFGAIFILSIFIFFSIFNLLKKSFLKKWKPPYRNTELRNVFLLSLSLSQHIDRSSEDCNSSNCSIRSRGHWILCSTGPSRSWCNLVRAAAISYCHGNSRQVRSSVGCSLKGT